MLIRLHKAGRLVGGETLPYFGEPVPFSDSGEQMFDLTLSRIRNTFRRSYNKAWPVEERGQVRQRIYLVQRSTRVTDHRPRLSLGTAIR
jgi:hypothetical protein